VVAWYALTYYRDLQQRRLGVSRASGAAAAGAIAGAAQPVESAFSIQHPHSIAELVHENPRLAEQSCLRSRSCLRKALHSSGAQEVTLAEELDFVKGYVEIEQLRLGERLSVTWDIAPDSLTARVPSLLLQPLIETPSSTAIAPSTRPGTLAIRARRDGDFFEVQVHDNGSGLAVNGSNRQGGVGLANTSDRLQRLYGERQRFELINDQGLRVNVRLHHLSDLMPHKGTDAA